MPALFQKSDFGATWELKMNCKIQKNQQNTTKWYTHIHTHTKLQPLTGYLSFPFSGHSGSPGEKEAIYLPRHFNHLCPRVSDKCCLLCPFWDKLALLLIITRAGAMRSEQMGRFNGTIHSLKSGRWNSDLKEEYHGWGGGGCWLICWKLR